MNNLFNALLNLSKVDDLVNKNTFIHTLHPLIKMIFTLIILIFIIETKKFMELLLYLVGLFFIAKSCQIPINKVIKRGLLSLPLCLCLGLSYLLLNQKTVYFLGFYMMEGIVLCLFLFIKMFLCLSYVYLLMATTSFDEIACELVFLKVPSLFVLQLIMTYRYIYLLLEETSLMARAYLLRSPDAKAIQMKDMGSFVGHLLMNSMKQSQDVYNCMKCRGFDIDTTYQYHKKIDAESCFLMMIVIGVLLLIKVVWI